MPPALKAAQDLFQTQQWAEAAAAYEVIMKTDKIDPRPRWFPSRVLPRRGSGRR
jgi:hypothetical protein